MSVNLLTIPLRNDLPFYSFNITLTGVTYQLEFLYNVRSNRWIMNIYDSVGNQIISGITLLIDRNLIGQYRYLNLPAGVFFVVDNTQQDEQPTLNSFGTTHTMYYVDPGTS